MINEELIKEIYKKYSKPAKNVADLNLEHYKKVLKEFHPFSFDSMELVFDNIEEFNPFKRFLLRRIHAVLELDNKITFVFENQMIFVDKDSPEMHVYFRPEKKSIFGKLFGK